MKGKCFESALEFGGGGVAVGLFLFWGAQGASQLPGCEGGNVLSQLWSLVVVASPSVFVLGGGGQSASGAVKGKCFESALEFGGGGVAVVAVVVFVLGGGGQSASGL